MSAAVLAETPIKAIFFGCRVIFGPESLKNILGEVVSAAGLNQLRAAETEKYPHVTFFFNGGVETPYKGEDRYLAISPKEVPTYDKKPAMSADGVADLFCDGIATGEYGFGLVNFANADMVGHTGVIPAVVEGCSTRSLIGLTRPPGPGKQSWRIFSLSIRELPGQTRASPQAHWHR